MAQCVLRPKFLAASGVMGCGRFLCGAKYDGGIGIISISRKVSVFPIEIVFGQLISFMSFRFNASSPTQPNWACGIQHGRSFVFQYYNRPTRKSHKIDVVEFATLIGAPRTN